MMQCVGVDYVQIYFETCFDVLMFGLQLVGGEFDIETNFIIQEPQNILHMLRVFSSCSLTLQVSASLTIQVQVGASLTLQV